MKRLLIAGSGDIARRALSRFGRRFTVMRLARAYGFDLDRPETLALGAALEKGRILPARMVYVSTSGVYGDCAGMRVEESRPPAPQTGRAPGIYNASDDTEMKMGDWFDVLADAYGLPRPPRVARTSSVSSFMKESRRLDKRKLKQQLGIRLQFPTIYEDLRHEQPLGTDQPA